MHVLHDANILQGVALDRDQIGQEAFGDLSPVIDSDELRAVDGGGAQGLDGRMPRLTRTPNSRASSRR